MLCNQQSRVAAGPHAVVTPSWRHDRLAPVDLNEIRDDLDEGHFISKRIAECAANHPEFASCVAQLTSDWNNELRVKTLGRDVTSA